MSLRSVSKTLRRTRKTIGNAAEILRRPSKVLGLSVVVVRGPLVVVCRSFLADVLLVLRLQLVWVGDVRKVVQTLKQSDYRRTGSSVATVAPERMQRRGMEL